jgi:NAD-dependent deacetylase
MIRDLLMEPFDCNSENVELISQKIIESEHFIALTGAGISTESGIPDYRSKGGIWDRFQPVYIDEFMRSREARVKYWSRKAELYPDLIKAQPNAAHQGLAELYKLVFLKSLITQNIDVLHQKAGIPDKATIELHGNNFRVRCMSCGRLTSIHEAQKRIESGDCAPECECGGYLKPDTISFGQSLRTDVLAQAYEQCDLCSMMLVIGSTLKVHPAAGLPGIAKQNGAFLAIINLSKTPCDDIIDIIIREKAGIAVRAIVDKIKEIV